MNSSRKSNSYISMLLGSALMCSPSIIFAQANPTVIEGDVEITGGLVVQDTVETIAGGVKFADGSVEFSAAASPTSESIGALSSNLGLYQNKIVNMTPPLPYVEVCFIGSGIQIDQHLGGESTNGGNCKPGDVGWVIEVDERAALSWEMAKAECLSFDMRLPEPFEFKYSCKEAGNLGLNNMSGNWEWASNEATVFIHDNNRQGLIAPNIGDPSCTHATHNWVANLNGNEASVNFRCAR